MGVLKQHLVEGYTLNQRRLQERGIEFEPVVDLLSRTLANQQLINPDGEAVLTVIHEYARSWSLLQGYDEQSLSELGSKQTDMRALDLDGIIDRELFKALWDIKDDEALHAMHRSWVGAEPGRGKINRNSKSV